MKLIFLVDQQTIKRIDKNVLISDSKEYVFAQFVFLTCCKDYETAQAVFWTDEETEYVDIDPNSDTCIIPDKFLALQSFKISLYLTNGSMAYPTNRINIDIKPSGFEMPSKPDVYSKLIERIEKLEKTITNTSSVSAFITKISELEDDVDTIYHHLEMNDQTIQLNTTSIAALNVRLLSLEEANKS